MQNFHATVRSYITGFVLSLVFTVTAFSLVEYHISSEHEVFTHTFLFHVIITLAILQALTQLFFFLHLGKETKPRWKLFIFMTTFIGICILVFGSIWIMNHLNYNMMPQDMSSYIIQQEGVQL